MLRGTSALLAVSALAPLTVASAAPTTIDTQARFGTPVMTAGATGELSLVWIDGARVRAAAGRGDVWSRPRTIGRCSTMVDRVVRQSPRGDVVVAWLCGVSASAVSLSVARRLPDGRWTAAQVLTPRAPRTRPDDYRLAMALGANGHAAIAFSAPTGVHAFTGSPTSLAWSTGTRLYARAAAPPNRPPPVPVAVAAHADGQVIAALAVPSADSRRVGLRLLVTEQARHGAPWSPRRALTAARDIQGLSLASENDGGVVLAWSQPDPARSLYDSFVRRRLPTGRWLKPHSLGPVGVPTLLATPNGEVLAHWTVSDDRLRVARARPGSNPFRGSRGVPVPRTSGEWTYSVAPDGTLAAAGTTNGSVPFAATLVGRRWRTTFPARADRVVGNAAGVAVSRERVAVAWPEPTKPLEVSAPVPRGRVRAAVADVRASRPTVIERILATTKAAPVRGQFHVAPVISTYGGPVRGVLERARGDGWVTLGALPLDAGERTPLRLEEPGLARLRVRYRSAGAMRSTPAFAVRVRPNAFPTFPAGRQPIRMVAAVDGLWLQGGQLDTSELGVLNEQSGRLSTFALTPALRELTSYLVGIENRAFILGRRTAPGNDTVIPLSYGPPPRHGAALPTCLAVPEPCATALFSDAGALRQIVGRVHDPHGRAGPVLADGYSWSLRPARLDDLELILGAQDIVVVRERGGEPPLMSAPVDFAEADLFGDGGSQILATGSHAWVVNSKGELWHWSVGGSTAKAGAGPYREIDERDGRIWAYAVAGRIDVFDTATGAPVGVPIAVDRPTTQSVTIIENGKRRVQTSALVRIVASSQFVWVLDQGWATVTRIPVSAVTSGR